MKPSPDKLDSIHPLALDWKCLHSSRTTKATITEADGNYICLASRAILAEAYLPIRLIHFRITSHDQGNSKPTFNGKGTYHNSHTWFEVWRLRNGVLDGPGLELTRNIHSKWESSVHEIGGMVAIDRRKNGPERKLGNS